MGTWVPLLSPAMTSFVCIIRISLKTPKNMPTHTSSSAPNVCISLGVVDDLCGQPAHPKCNYRRRSVAGRACVVPRSDPTPLID
jgi:hypothetical protein